ncbi:MAG: hypothetical protein JXA57_07775 [Armatimonadetes bacterium]|nr:hypothetical protein [Armatimonadota bacterium]
MPGWIKYKVYYYSPSRRKELVVRGGRHLLLGGPLLLTLLPVSLFAPLKALADAPESTWAELSPIARFFLIQYAPLPVMGCSLVAGGLSLLIDGIVGQRSDAPGPINCCLLSPLALAYLAGPLALAGCLILPFYEFGLSGFAAHVLPLAELLVLLWLGRLIFFPKKDRRFIAFFRDFCAFCYDFWEDWLGDDA